MNIDTNLANQILGFLIKGPAPDTQIVQNINIPHDTLQLYLQFMKLHNGSFIEIIDYGNDWPKVISIPSYSIEGAKVFLAQGGYRQLAEAKRIMEQKTEEEKQAYLDNLKANTQLANDTMKHNKNTRILSIIAIIISLLAIIVAYVQKNK